jgi:hypothetical protein
MTTLTADANLKNLLAQITDVTNVVDDDGHLLGVITPKAHAEELLYQKVKGLFSLDELEQRKLEKGGYTLEQIKERLRLLENAG